MTEEKKENKKIEDISSWKRFNRCYNAKEFIDVVTRLIKSGRYEDFVLVAGADDGHWAVRIGSEDNDLHKGDVLLLLESVKDHLMNEDW